MTASPARHIRSRRSALPARAAHLALALGATLTVLQGCGGVDLGLKPGATSVLQGLQGPSPEEAARMAIDPYDTNNRFKGINILANLPFASEDVYLKLFEKTASDPDSGVRAASIRALGIHGNPTHARLIVEKLNDRNDEVRRESARALQRIHDPVAMQPLLDHLAVGRESEPAVRVEVATALGQYGDPKVVEALIRALDDEYLAVNTAALNSLRTLTGQDLSTDRLVWDRWYKQTVASAKNPFDARAPYLYPVFTRGKFWYENIPFFPPPPNETPSTPAGLPQGL